MQKSVDSGRRREQRYAAKLDAQFAINGKAGFGVITNLSASGLQIECERETLFDLMPNIQRPDPRNPTHLEVSFQLSRGDAEELTLTCDMKYARRLSRERFLIGGEHLNLTQAVLSNLSKFFTSANPAEDREND